MSQALRSEWTKLAALRGTWWSLLATLIAHHAADAADHQRFQYLRLPDPGAATTTCSS